MLQLTITIIIILLIILILLVSLVYVVCRDGGVMSCSSLTAFLLFWDVFCVRLSFFMAFFDIFFPDHWRKNSIIGHLLRSRHEEVRNPSYR